MKVSLDAAQVKAAAIGHFLMEGKALESASTCWGPPMVSFADIPPEFPLPGGSATAVLGPAVFLGTGVAFFVAALVWWHGGFKTGLGNRLASRIGPRRALALMLALGSSSLIVSAVMVVLDRPPPRRYWPRPTPPPEPTLATSSPASPVRIPVGSE